MEWPNGDGKKKNPPPRGDVDGDRCEITFEKHRKIQIGVQIMEIVNRIAVFPPRLLFFLLVAHVPHSLSSWLHRSFRLPWGLPKSLASYMLPLPFRRYPNLPHSRSYYLDASNGLIWIEVTLENYYKKSFVGNPVLQEWVEIPPPPEPCQPQVTGLVTRGEEEEEDGVVSSFKVVRT